MDVRCISNFITIDDVSIYTTCIVNTSRNTLRMATNCISLLDVGKTVPLYIGYPTVVG